MGSCVSVHRNSESALKLSLSFASKDDKLVIPPSPVKETPTNGINDNSNVEAVKSRRSSSRSEASFRGCGSKEETFFDSKAWLESDCEDDFFSVNGDFTPSRGSTPVHHNFSVGSPRINKSRFEDRFPGSIYVKSPANEKKKLAELFRESSKNNHRVDDLNTSGNQHMANGNMEVQSTALDLPPKSGHGTPYGTNSVCSSERTPNGNLFTAKEKTIKSVQCCLPSLMSCRSFSERKKKMDATMAVDDEP